MPTPTATVFLPYHALDDVIQRGTRAAQPDAADVVPGTLYCVTDEGHRLERSSGSAWELAAPTGSGGQGGAPDPHAVTHTAQGSDPVLVTALAGYPGGGTTFLRDDGTFAAAAGPAGPEGPPGPQGSAGEAGADAAIVADAQYWVSTPHATLTAERNLGALASGYVKATIAAGVATPSTVATIPTTDGGTGVTTGLTVLNADNLTSGTVPAARLTATNLPAHAARHQPGGADAMTVDAAAATGSLRTLGTGANQAAPGNDARFTAPSTPTAHATTHQPGGSDAMAIDAIAATGSLRTLGTGANQAAPGNDTRFTAAPQLHHATHEPGGTDVLANNAWTNVANTFTENQTLSKGVPRLTLNDTDQPADLRVMQLLNGAQGLYVRALNDAQSAVLSTPLILTRPGDAFVGRDLYAAGSNGNVACKDQANTFTSIYNAFQSSVPRLAFKETGGTSGARNWRLISDGAVFYIQTIGEADDTQAHILQLHRNGDTFVGRDVYEKGRTTPMGHWIDVGYSAGNFTGSGAMTWTVEAGDVVTFAYFLVGKTITVNIFIQSTSVGGTPDAYLIVNVPFMVSTRYVDSVTKLNDNNSQQVGLIRIFPGESLVRFHKVSGSWSLASNATSVFAQFSYPIA